MFQSFFKTLTTQPQQMMREWNEAVRQQVTRLEALNDDAEKVQAETAERTTENLDRATELGRHAQAEALSRSGEALDLVSKLTKQAWSQGTEALDHAVELTKAAQADAMSRAGEANAEATKLFHELRSHAGEWPRQWRKAWLDMVRKGLDVSSPDP
jgi:chromosome segregation ATPase